MNNNFLLSAISTIEEEANAISGLKKYLDETFNLVIETIGKCTGKVVITGIGKSGIVGLKISATLSSTGTPSVFLHPGEAYHGDLGLVSKEDIVMALSKSGETDEVLKLLPFFKSNRNTVIALTEDTKSTLAVYSDYCIQIKVKKEACPLSLAPTTSATAFMVMGDAIAIALMKYRDFKAEDYARFHPGGTLGKKLLVNVEGAMHKNGLPVISKNKKLIDVIQCISEGKLGMAVIVEDNKIKGILTDGDVRRLMERKKEVFFDLIAQDVMILNPKTINPEAKLIDAEKMMNDNKITGLLVANRDNELLGVIQIYDMYK